MTFDPAKENSKIDSLVSRAREGDAGAFGKIYDMYIEKIYRHVYYRTGNTCDAEDLTQSVFIKAWEAINKYRKSDVPFKAWLYRIAQNTVIDFYRLNKKKMVADLESDIVDTSLRSNPQLVIESQYDQRELRKAILKLPENQKQVVLMRFIDDFSYAEIAQSLGKSEGSVRVIVHRAITEIKKILNKNV